MTISDYSVRINYAKWTKAQIYRSLADGENQEKTILKCSRITAMISKWPKNLQVLNVGYIKENNGWHMSNNDLWIYLIRGSKTAAIPIKPLWNYPQSPVLRSGNEGKTKIFSNWISISKRTKVKGEFMDTWEVIVTFCYRDSINGSTRRVEKRNWLVNLIIGRIGD